MTKICCVRENTVELSSKYFIQCRQSVSCSETNDKSAYLSKDDDGGVFLLSLFFLFLFAWKYVIIIVCVCMFLFF